MPAQKTTAWILTLIAVICTCITCLSLAISLATDNWQYTRVDRVGLRKIIPYKPELYELMKTNELYFDRTRGLFFWCSSALNVQGVVSKDVCVEDLAFNDGVVLDFSHTNSANETQNMIERIDMRNNLVIAMVAIVAAAIGCSLVTCLVGISSVFKGLRVLLTLGMTFSFLCTMCAGSAMAIFHGVDYLEKTKLAIYVFPAAMRENPAYNELKTHTNIQHGYSYALGWAGVLMSTTSALLYLQARNKTKPIRKVSHRAETITSSSTSLFREPPKFDSKSLNSKKEFGSKESVRNNAYDMMETGGLSVEGSEKGSSRTPTSDDWSPYNELPPGDSINTQ